MARTKQSAFLRNYNLTLLPNIKEEFGLRGSVIRVVSAAVPIFFESRDGSSSFYLEQGEQIVFDDGNDNIFFQLELYHSSGVAQNVVLAVGENASIGSAKIGGTVGIVGAVALDAASLAALESVDLNSVTRDLLRFESYGAAFSQSAVLAANVPVTIFTPAANANGAIVHAASFVSENAGIIMTTLIAKSGVPPLTVTDGDVICAGDSYSIGAARIISGSLKRPIKIAAGKGLYYIASALESQVSAKYALYSLL